MEDFFINSIMLAIAILFILIALGVILMMIKMVKSALTPEIEIDEETIDEIEKVLSLEETNDELVHRQRLIEQLYNYYLKS